MRFYVSTLENKKAVLEEQIAVLKEEYFPMRFRITREGGAISVEMKFLDTDGNEAGKAQFDIAGSELFIDVAAVCLNEGAYLFFPYRAFTDEIAPIDGVPLCGEYDEGGFPLIYRSAGSKGKAAASSQLSQVFSSIKDGTFIFDKIAHGNAVHDMKELSGFKSGFVYDVLCHPHTGAVEVVQ